METTGVPVAKSRGLPGDREGALFKPNGVNFTAECLLVDRGVLQSSFLCRHIAVSGDATLCKG